MKFKGTVQHLFTIPHLTQRLGRARPEWRGECLHAGLVGRTSWRGFARPLRHSGRARPETRKYGCDFLPPIEILPLQITIFCNFATKTGNNKSHLLFMVFI